MRHVFASSLAGGVRALHKGVAPTIVRGIVLSETQICSYDQSKQTRSSTHWNGVCDGGRHPTTPCREDVCWVSGGRGLSLVPLRLIRRDRLFWF